MNAQTSVIAIRELRRPKCPAILTTTNIQHAAKIMRTRHLRHLPVAGDAGLLGVVDLIDVCRTLING